MTNHLRRRLLLATAAVFVLACKKSPVSRLSEARIVRVALDKVTEAREDAEIKARIARINADPALERPAKEYAVFMAPKRAIAEFQEAKDRQELVLPPPPGWKPENADWKIKLTLIPETNRLSLKGAFRYRLEIQNVGRAAIRFFDHHDRKSFIKTGGIESHDRYKDAGFGFLAVLPNGMTVAIPGPMPVCGMGRYDPEKSPLDRILDNVARKKNWAQEREEAAQRTEITIQSGETLFTRPSPPPPNRFHDLQTDSLFFRTPGVYRIKAIFNDFQVHPPTEKEIARREWLGQSREAQKLDFESQKRRNLGHVESNEVELEVIK